MGKLKVKFEYFLISLVVNADFTSTQSSLFTQFVQLIFDGLLFCLIIKAKFVDLVYLFRWLFQRFSLKFQSLFFDRIAEGLDVS